MQVRKGLILAVKGSAILVALFLLAAHVWGGLHAVRGPFQSIGNFDSHVGMLPPVADGKYRFAVMGDPEDGIEVFEELLKKAHNNGCRFIVLCGDLVHGNEEWRYRYLLNELSEERFQNPIFTVIGNHDDYDRFRRYFGPENFHFRYGNSLFILIDNAIRPPTLEQTQWLEGILEKHRKEVRHTFLFLHRPLFRIAKGSEERVQPDPDEARFIKALEKYSIRTVFSGHLHSYRRIRMGEIDHIVTGGAGATLQEPDADHHYVQVDVEGDAIHVSRVRAMDSSSVWDLLEQFFVGRIYFGLQARPLFYSIPAVFFLWVLLVLIRWGGMGSESKSVSASALTPFQKWYFTRRGPILVPFCSVLLLCFWNECEIDWLIWPLGMLLLGVGIFVRLWAIRYLGRHSRKVGMKAKALSCEGPYGLVRNPVYIANIVVAAAFCVLCELMWYLPIFMAVMMVHYNIVVRCEEVFLAGKFGEEYLSYKKRVPRWIPRRVAVAGHPLLRWKDVIAEEMDGTWLTAAGLLVCAGKEYLDHALRGWF